MLADLNFEQYLWYAVMSCQDRLQNLGFGGVESVLLRILKLKGRTKNLTLFILVTCNSAALWSRSNHVTEEAINKHEPLSILFVDVSQEIQGRLFSPFFQALGTNRKFGGTGLGLSICKKLSELMKGEIGIVSKEGEGSIFWFEVPIQAKATMYVTHHIMT